MLSAHVMLSRILDVEELLLTDEEGAEFAAAIQEVNELYGNEWISKELSAWINLTVTATMIYVPRYMAYSARMKKEKRERGPIEIPFHESREGETAKPS